MTSDVKGYNFAGCFLDVQRRQLLVNRQPLALNQRQITLLVMLAEASPQVVPKEQLLQHIWAGRVVSDNSLAKLVSDTRNLLKAASAELASPVDGVIKTAKNIGFYMSDVEAVPLRADKRQYFIRPWVGWAAAGVLLLFALVLWPLYQQQQTVAAVKRIVKYQQNTYTTFVAQATRRNELVAMLEQRLQIKRQRQFEKFFSQYFARMNDEERFVCAQIRAMTETGLYQNNAAILHELQTHPRLLQHIALAGALEKHLAFWLNKYQSVFLQREDMCLLYVGVEDGVPYPAGVDKQVLNWLAEQEQGG